MLYNVKLRRKTTPQYLLLGSQPVYVVGDKDVESQDSPDQHPQVVQEDDPAEVAAREKLLEAKAAVARREWSKIAKAKRWDTVRAPLSVCRHSGAKLSHDPRLEKEYKEKVEISKKKSEELAKLKYDRDQARKHLRKGRSDAKTGVDSDLAAAFKAGTLVDEVNRLEEQFGYRKRIGMAGLLGEIQR